MLIKKHLNIFLRNIFFFYSWLLAAFYILLLLWGEIIEIDDMRWEGRKMVGRLGGVVLGPRGVAEIVAVGEHGGECLDNFSGIKLKRL